MPRSALFAPLPGFRGVRSGGRVLLAPPPIKRLARPCGRVRRTAEGEGGGGGGDRGSARAQREREKKRGRARAEPVRARERARVKSKKKKKKRKRRRTGCVVPSEQAALLFMWTLSATATRPRHTPLRTDPRPTDLCLPRAFVRACVSPSLGDFGRDRVHQ